MQDVAQGSVCDSEKEAQSSDNSIFGSDTSDTSPNKHNSFDKLDDKCSETSGESETEDEDISEVRKCFYVLTLT